MNQLPISLPGEVWKDIPGYEGRYAISTLGRVWTFRRNTSGLLSPCPDKKGYPRVSLRGKTKKVHRLVLQTFVGPCPPGLEAGHMDGDASRPHLDNLAWITKPQNAAHRKVHDTNAEGFAHGAVKATPEDVRRIRALRRAGAMWKDIAEGVGLSVSATIEIGTGVRFADFEPETIVAVVRSSGRTSRPRIAA